MEKAVEILRVKMGNKLGKLAGREATEGTVQSYIHANGKVGVLVEVDCNTDFVATQRGLRRVRQGRRAAHRRLAADPVGHRGRGARGRARRRDARLRAAGRRQAREHARAKIAEGKLRKWLEEVVLLDQAHVNADKHDGKTIEQLRGRPLGQDRRERRHPPLHALRRRRVATRRHAPSPVFKRILLKLSGESLMGALDYGTDPERVAGRRRASQAGVHEQGVEIAIVVGAGNIYRGMAGAAAGMDRATADYMGMLATVLNALPLQDALEKLGRPHARAERDPRRRGRRALHPPPRDAPPREGPRRHLRRRHRQPVLHHRHRRRAARASRSTPRRS